MEHRTIATGPIDGRNDAMSRPRPNGRLGVALLAALAVAAAPVATGRDVGAHAGSSVASSVASPLSDIAVPVELLTDGVTGADPATAAADVAAVGGEVVATTPTGVVTARVPLGDLAQLEERTAAYVRAPVHLDVRPQRAPAPMASTGVHVDVTAADDWHAAGFTGAGIRVGVIDFFNVPAFWDTDEMGPEPVANVTARCIDIGSDCVSDLYGETPEVGDDHGPAVVEVIRDMAPEAEIYIGRATTESDYYELVDWFAANGVRIVNRSLGSRYDGPGDGRGALTSLADYAVGRGITWFNSAGNSGIDRYYRQPARVVGDAVAFGPSGTDTWLPFNGCIALGEVRWANDWDVPAAQRTDYDAFVVQAPSGD
ncbi:MAG: S8 family serine peptidase, partial [Ilumatobacteraceae bacterium]